jgi:hypothetical protein
MEFYAYAKTLANSRLEKEYETLAGMQPIQQVRPVATPEAPLQGGIMSGLSEELPFCNFS